MSAQATPVSFSFGGTGTTNFSGASSSYDPSRTDLSVVEHGTSWDETQTTTGGSLSLSVSAFAFMDGASGVDNSQADLNGVQVNGRVLGDNSIDQNSRVTQVSDGLGIVNNIQPSVITDDSPYHADGSSSGVFGTGWLDFFVLDFDREVAFDTLGLASYDADDRFRLIYDVNGDGIVGNQGDLLSEEFNANTSTGLFDQFAGLTGTSLGILAAADSENANANTEWRLSSLVVNVDDGGSTPTTDPTPDVAPVPLPAAGWMLIAGFGGLAAMRRFQRS